jgi:hypothetical protein
MNTDCCDPVLCKTKQPHSADACVFAPSKCTHPPESQFDVFPWSLSFGGSVAIKFCDCGAERWPGRYNWEVQKSIATSRDPIRFVMACEERVRRRGNTPV